MVGKPRCRDATALAGEFRGILIHDDIATAGLQGSPKRMKGGQRAVLVRIYEDSDIHNSEPNDGMPVVQAA